METRQARLVKESLTAPVARDYYAKRVKPAADLDLVSIELSLITVQARAAGLASIEDNSNPAYRTLVENIDAALLDVERLREAKV